MAINSYSDQRIKIENHFKENWGSISKVVYPNTKQKIPSTVPWVRFLIRDGVASQESIGRTQLHRNTGIVVIEVFVPRGTGTGKINTLCDFAVKVFNVKQLDTIQFRVPYINDIGEIEEVYQKNVICEFYNNVIFTRTDL